MENPEQGAAQLPHVGLLIVHLSAMVPFLSRLEWKYVNEFNPAAPEVPNELVRASVDGHPSSTDTRAFHGHRAEVIKLVPPLLASSSPQHAKLGLDLSKVLTPLEHSIYSELPDPFETDTVPYFSQAIADAVALVPEAIRVLSPVTHQQDEASWAIGTPVPNGSHATLKETSKAEKELLVLLAEAETRWVQTGAGLFTEEAREHFGRMNRLLFENRDTISEMSATAARKLVGAYGAILQELDARDPAEREVLVSFRAAVFRAVFDKCARAALATGVPRRLASKSEPNIYCEILATLRDLEQKGASLCVRQVEEEGLKVDSKDWEAGIPGALPREYFFCRVEIGTREVDAGDSGKQDESWSLLNESVQQLGGHVLVLESSRFPNERLALQRLWETWKTFTKGRSHVGLDVDAVQDEHGEYHAYQHPLVSILETRIRDLREATRIAQSMSFLDLIAPTSTSMNDPTEFAETLATVEDLMARCGEAVVEALYRADLLASIAELRTSLAAGCYISVMCLAGRVVEIALKHMLRTGKASFEEHDTIEQLRLRVQKAFGGTSLSPEFQLVVQTIQQYRNTYAHSREGAAFPTADNVRIVVAGLRRLWLAASTATPGT